ncbi:magnesium transporter [Fimbriiglobus ruber]|uniref:Magnesium transporter MgtE n=1 Tax=Fimbriiglobus ruber TaxID=1908690 RepID=A0A225DP83_9BACT|nr:magnesium transporter [Fimbriiglobus ruber]OWK38165.1 Mg/Co/Ni transporter MgtE / CBS domain [Fimbriiglobus ruber]
MSHPLFGPEVREMLAEKNTDGLRAFCETLHPATVAETLDDGFTPEQVWEAISPTDIRTQAAIFEYLPNALQVEMVEGEARPQVGQLIGKMSHDDRVDLLRRVPARVKESLLRLVDEADRRDIAILFKYGEDTVAALMTTDYAWLPPMVTAAEAVDLLRTQAPDTETIYYIYILDEPRRRADGAVAPRKLLGAVSLRDLILAPRQALLRDLMEQELVFLKYDDTKEKAAELLARYDFIAIPVVDDTLGMIGIVTHDDVIDIITEAATENLQKQAGVSPLGAEYLDASFYRLWRSRAFWLSLLFVAELFTFTAMSFFEDAIAAVVVLSLFVPLCISTGGNSGSQAATLVTRALALGQITPRDWRRVFRRELLMGLALGLTLGGIGFVRGALTPEDTRSGPRKVDEPFVLQVPSDAPLKSQGVGVGWWTNKVETEFEVPKDATVVRKLDQVQRVRVPADVPIPVPEKKEKENVLEYAFPKDCEVRTNAVNALALGQVVAWSVMGICLWGTLIGAMLPLLFKHYGGDPALASSPFVATAVDVTGIVIFFTIARAYLI